MKRSDGSTSCRHASVLGRSDDGVHPGRVAAHVDVALGEVGNDAPQRLGVAQVGGSRPATSCCGRAGSVADDGDDTRALQPRQLSPARPQDDVGLAADPVDDDDGVGTRRQVFQQGPQRCDADAGTDEQGPVAGARRRACRPAVGSLDEHGGCRVAASRGDALEAADRLRR